MYAANFWIQKAFVSGLPISPLPFSSLGRTHHSMKTLHPGSTEVVIRLKLPQAKAAAFSRNFHPDKQLLAGEQKFLVLLEIAGRLRYSRDKSPVREK